jgi:hypothetical protein
MDDNQFTSNWQYRMFLQKNAENIIRQDFQHAINSTGVSAKYPSSLSLCLPQHQQKTDLEEAYLNKWNHQRSLISPSIHIGS